MQTYIMLGKYSAEGLKDASPNRTEKAVHLIKELGGEVLSMYALLGVYDLVLIVSLPQAEIAMKVSMGISMLSGISFDTLPAVSVDDFDRIIGEI